MATNTPIPPKALQNEFSDYRSNIAMKSRTFSPTDFAALAALTEDQLLAGICANSDNILGSFNAKLDSLRADLVKALAISNLYRSEEWRAQLWHLGPNEEHIQDAGRPALMVHRASRLKFCKDGIDMSAGWLNGLQAMITTMHAIYPQWKVLVEKLKVNGNDQVAEAKSVARLILGEQKVLSDYDQFVGGGLERLAAHRGLPGWDYVVDGAGSRRRGGGKAGFTWISLR